MKKIFLLFAFSGIVGASSATVTLNKATTVTFKQDERKKACCKKDAGHDCSKHAKGECHKGMNDSTKRDCSKHHDKKSCCKKGAPATTPAK